MESLFSVKRMVVVDYGLIKFMRLKVRSGIRELWDNFFIWMVDRNKRFLFVIFFWEK